MVCSSGGGHRDGGGGVPECDACCAPAVSSDNNFLGHPLVFT